MSLQDSIVVARSAMMAHQERLNVASNNVANVNTPGYHRQKVALGTNPYVNPTIAEARHYPISTGVRVLDVIRSYDSMKENMLLQQQSDVDYHTQKGEALGDIESLVNASGDASLSVQLQNFWSSWQDLANNADSLTFRSVLLEKSAALADQINNIAGRLTTYRDGIASGGGGPAFSGAVDTDINEINTIATELKDLNYRINYAQSSYSPHNLMDQRTKLLQDLSQKANITVTADSSVFIGGQLLVSGDGATQNALSITDTTTDPIGLSLNGAGITVTGGSLGAWVDTAAVIDTLSANLDTMANELITSVNAIHNTTKRGAGSSYDLDGNVSNIDFFTGTSAATISVNPAIHDSSNPLADDPRLIAAAATCYQGIPGTPNPGDGARALEVADLVNQKFGALNGRTFTEYFSGQAASLGAMVASEQSQASDAAAVVSTLKDAIQGDSGVNLDEEMMEMMSAQRAYQAATRLFTTIDSMLDQIINRLGV